MDEKFAEEMRDLIKATRAQHNLTAVGGVKLFGQVAVGIADATLDAMTWPNGKPEEKR